MSNTSIFRQPEVQDLITATLSLKGAEEAAIFLRDLLTEKEILEFSRRLKAAALLNKNVPYTKITDKTGLSSTTVARIAKWLKGPLGGYRAILPRLHTTPPRR